MLTIGAKAERVLVLESTADVDGEVIVNCPIETQVVLRVSITINGNPYDPIDVVLQERRFGFPARTYRYSTAGLTKDSDGHYSRLVLLDKPGEFRYRFTATGTATIPSSTRGTTGDIIINVDPSEFASL